MYELMDGAVGDAIGAGMEAKGIVALAWYDSGARSFYNSIRPINTPSDVEGLKVRVMNNDLFVGMVESMGGNATPMAFGEVYQSIKTGVVDGAENNPPSYESTSHQSMEKVQAGGTTVNKIADKAPFQEAMAAVYENFLAANPDLTDLVNLIRNAE